MTATRPIIALDGPAAAGKTTVGRRLAERLGWTFVDTGVLYRALTLLARERGVAPGDEAGLAALARRMDLRVGRPTVADGRDADVSLGGRDVTWAIREPEIDRQVSIVAAHPAVRAALLAAQRQAPGDAPAVVAGRDIGTVIFPEAALKVFLDAAPHERSRRRAADSASRPAGARDAAVLDEILARDALDRERTAAPLRPDADAIELPTDNLDVEAVVDRVLALWRQRAVAGGDFGRRP